MKKSSLLLFIFPVLLHLGGCGSDSKKLVGTWVRTGTYSSSGDMLFAPMYPYKAYNYEFFGNNKLINSYELRGSSKVGTLNGEWHLETSDTNEYPFVLILSIDSDNETRKTKNKLKFISEKEFHIIGQDGFREVYRKK